MTQQKRIGVALSGGGVRAAAFHLGVLSKLHDLGILRDVDVISAVSGGSITGAFYMLFGGEFAAFKDAMIRALQRSIERRIVFNWRAPALLWPGYSLTDIKAAVYDDVFFEGKTLSALRARPQLIINATNLMTGKNFKMSQEYLGDWKVGYGGLPSVMRISTAVAASTAVPGIFRPIRLRTDTYFPQPLVPMRYLALCDGGVYDNQGTHSLTSDHDRGLRCSHIVCSDASAPFGEISSPPLRFVSVLRRQSDAMMARIKNMQYQQLLYGDLHKSIKTAFFSIEWTCGKILTQLSRDRERCAALGLTSEMDALRATAQAKGDIGVAVNDVAAKLGIKDSSNYLRDEAVRDLASVATRLRALTENEISRLMHHGSSLCELQVRIYLADLLPTSTGA